MTRTSSDYPTQVISWGLTLLVVLLHQGEDRFRAEFHIDLGKFYMVERKHQEALRLLDQGADRALSPKK